MLELIGKILPGIPTSLILTVTALSLAFMLAVLFTLVLTLKLKITGFFVNAFVMLFTGTPLLIQFFLIYYGPGQFDWIRNTPWLWQTISNPWFCSILALTLNSAAYTTQLFHGAVKAIPQGYWEGCTALGMSNLQSCNVLLRYALKRSIPAYSNEMVLIFKSTSLASTITLMDIMGYSSQLYGLTYDIRIYLAAGIVYLTINGLLTLLMRQLEKRSLTFELSAATS